MSDPPYLYWIICLHSQIYKPRDTSNAVSNQQLSKPFFNLKPRWKLSLSINPSGRFSVDSRRWNYRNVSTVFRTLNAGPLGELFKIDRIIKTKSESVKYFFGLFLWESFYSFEYGLPCFHSTNIFITLNSHWSTFVMVAWVSLPCRYTEMMYQYTVPRKRLCFPRSEFFFFFYQRMFSIRTQWGDNLRWSFSWTNFEGRHVLAASATL